MNILILASTIVAITSLLGLAGGVMMLAYRQRVEQYAHYFQAFAVGAMSGVVLFDLLPESFALTNTELVSWLIAGGLFAFFLIEKAFIINHCDTHGIEFHAHDNGGRMQATVQLIQIGDTIHNFLDGIVVGTAFLVSVPVGMATAFAQIAHEIPQEMSDFSILLRAGLSKARILWLNAISSLSSVLGAVLVILLGTTVEHATAYLLPFACGGFMYLSFSHLLPELHHDTSVKRSCLHLALVALGLIIIYGLMVVVGE